MEKSENALSYFNNSFNCAQSVFATFGPEIGIPENECLKIACGFGAGMGKQQHVCGAVSGALMVIGSKFGKALNDDESKKELTYKLTEEFMHEFKSRNGSIYCIDLLHRLNMNNEDDLIKIHEQALFETVCEKAVKDAVEITEKIISKF